MINNIISRSWLGTCNANIVSAHPRLGKGTITTITDFNRHHQQEHHHHHHREDHHDHDLRAEKKNDLQGKLRAGSKDTGSNGSTTSTTNTTNIITIINKIDIISTRTRPVQTVQESVVPKQKQYRLVLVDTCWYWVSMKRYWLIYDGTGSVEGGTG